MNRQTYLQMRKTGQYDFSWFYQYFLENRDRNRATVSFEMFQQVFNMYFQMNGASIIESMDKKMEVTKIENEQGQLLYIN